MPNTLKHYVHRVGRTARAGKKGRSVMSHSYMVQSIDRICMTTLCDGFTSSIIFVIIPAIMGIS